MDPSVYENWNSIRSAAITNNGNWISYNQDPGKGDKNLVLYDNRNHKEYRFPRSSAATHDFASKFIAFSAHAPYDTVQAMKRRKVKKKKMPKDTLVIFDTTNRTAKRMGAIKGYALPKEWGNFIVYHLADKRDTSKKVKKESKKNGSKLVLHNYYTDWSDTLSYVTDFTIAEKGKYVAAVSTGKDSTEDAHIIIYDLIKKSESIVKAEGHGFSNLSLSKNGAYLAYLENMEEDEKAQIPNHILNVYNIASATTKKIRNPRGKELLVSKEFTPRFSDDETRLFYGNAPVPIVQDTTLLDEEIVNVEVWSYTDEMLYTQQEMQLDREKKKSYLYAYDIIFGKSIELGSEEIPFVFTTKEGESKYALGGNSKPYEKYISWKGYPYYDIYRINMETGAKKKLLTKEEGRVRLSPGGKYGYWYNRESKEWKTVDLASGTVSVIAAESDGIFYDELNDTPQFPRSYGTATWAKDDAFIYIYDRFDIWQMSPDGNVKKKLTNGRADQIVYRYLRLDDELDAISPDTTVMLNLFDENDKSSGYATLNLATQELKVAIKELFRFDRSPIKAKRTDDLVITKESFRVFPNLISTNLDLADQKVISDANPQQSKYKWGDAELFSWTNDKGEELDGLLIKPDDFNPANTYPVIVNFYERSSNGLYRHRAPAPHRSTINYSYWVNKGYVIFNPDVTYDIGYPGESCYDDVISGVKSLSQKPWVDKSKIGVQGHSWGGYQIAHLLTRTDIFKCAEAGAPVVNMVSAYGGIRWRTGMSRMFQYEKTQSRLGATLWENPQLYLDNSPIFNVDKVNTPVLILHNDKDGAVPWYQGIEYFVALRRLGKPAWMLNYNGEPHWPVKWQNRVDFNKRLEQFFDHYLMDKPMPQWMKKGVAPIEKGINQGFGF